MDDIQDAVNFMPDLPVPGYIPEGFELETLTVVKYMNGSYWAEYNFKNEQKNTIILTSRSIEDDGATAGLTYEMEEFLINGYKAYYWVDSYTSSYGISIIMEKQLVDITGNINRDIVQKIAESI